MLIGFTCCFYKRVFDRHINAHNICIVTSNYSYHLVVNDFTYIVPGFGIAPYTRDFSYYGQGRRRIGGDEPEIHIKSISVVDSYVGVRLSSEKQQR